MFSHSLTVWYHVFVAQSPMSALSHTAHRFSQVTWCHNTLKPCSSHTMANGERNSYGRFSGRLLPKALHCISTLSHHPHKPTEPSGAFRASVSRATTARDQTTDNLISGRSALRPAPLMHLKDHYTYLALESKPVQQNQISSFIPHISLPWFKKTKQKTNLAATLPTIQLEQWQLGGRLECVIWVVTKRSGLVRSLLPNTTNLWSVSNSDSNDITWGHLSNFTQLLLGTQKGLYCFFSQMQ